MKLRPVRIEGDVAYVPLTRGYEAIIDAASVDLVGGFNWFATEARMASGGVYTAYALRHEPGSRKKLIKMHRALIGAPDGIAVDHIDGNGLNNRISNLRLATASQNAWNSRTRIDNSSGIKGVSWSKQKQKWYAYINISGIMINLGLYDKLEDAADARASANESFHGEFGRLK